MLTMQHQIHFGDLVWMQHTVLAEPRLDTGNIGPRALTIDDTVDDNMGDVDALWTEFAGNALSGHT